MLSLYKRILLMPLLLLGGCDLFSPHSPAVTNPEVTNPEVTKPEVTNPEVTNPPVVVDSIPFKVQFSGTDSFPSTMAHDFAPIRIGNEWTYRKFERVFTNAAVFPGWDSLLSEIRISVDSVQRIGSNWKSYLHYQESGTRIYHGIEEVVTRPVRVDTQFIVTDDGNRLSTTFKVSPFLFHSVAFADTIYRDSDPDPLFSSVFLLLPDGVNGRRRVEHTSGSVWSKNSSTPPNLYDQGIGLVDGVINNISLSLSSFREGGVEKWSRP
jgi:hypothetical protein